MSMYELNLDPKRRYLEIVLRGYWDDKVINAFERVRPKLRLAHP